jgi:hypothetical protein
MDRDVRLLECDGRELKPTFKVGLRVDLAADCRVCANKKSHSSSGFGNRRAQFPQIGRTSSHYQLISKIQKIWDIHTLIFRALQTLHPSLDFLWGLFCGLLSTHIVDEIPKQRTDGGHGSDVFEVKLLSEYRYGAQLKV